MSAMPDHEPQPDAEPAPQETGPEGYDMPEFIPDDAPDKGLAAVDPLPASDGGASAAEVPLPPASSTQRGDTFGPAVLTIQTLPVEPDLGELPKQVEQKPAAEPQLGFFVPDIAVARLWERLSRAKARIDQEINNQKTAGLLLDQLKFARNELLAGRENYEEAERYVNEVEFRLTFYQRMYTWSRTLGVSLFFYELVWGVGLLAYLVFGLGAPAFTNIPAAQWLDLPPDFIYLQGSMAWGAIGGVIGGMMGLVTHIAWEQNFDRQHSLWYLTSPVIGLALGAVVYLVIRTGLLSIVGPTEGIQSPLVIYLFACLSGYQQNIFTRLVKRVLQAFRLDDESQAPAGGELPAEGPKHSG